MTRTLITKMLSLVNKPRDDRGLRGVPASRHPAGCPHHRLVKGGSWNDPLHRARTAFEQQYLAEQQVFDVGFRVIVQE